MEYKVAYLTAKVAENDATQTKAAIGLLEKYMAAHPDSWQIINFPKLLVPLQLGARDIDGAQKTLDKLSSSPKISPGLKQELNLMAIKILLEGRKYDEAEKKLTEQIKVTKDEAQAFRLRISLAETMAQNKKFPKAKAELQDIISKTNNAEMK